MNFFKKNLAIFPLYSCTSKLNESDVTICVVNYKKNQHVPHDLVTDSPAKRRRISFEQPTLPYPQLKLKSKLKRPELENYKPNTILNHSIRAIVSTSDKSFYRKSSKYAKVTYRPVTFVKKPKSKQSVNSNMKVNIYFIVFCLCLVSRLVTWSC